MSEKSLVNRIKQGGYWRVAITPGEYVENRYSHAALKEILRVNRIALRGWDYPHVDHQNTYNRIGFVESYCEFKHHLEYLRFYRSGKFVHLFGMRENALASDYLVERYSWYVSDTPPDNLRGFSILSSLYTLTEIFMFMCKIGPKDISALGGKLDLELHGLENRMLYFEDFGRDLNRVYICRDDCVKLSVPIPVGGIEEQIALKTACNWLEEIVSHFQWDGEHYSFFEAEQRKFLKI